MKLLNKFLRLTEFNTALLSAKSIALRIHRLIRAIEPWGILLAVAALLIDLSHREEDRIVGAISQFAAGAGRQDALNILVRNGVDLSAFKATGSFLPGVDFRGFNLQSADFSDALLDGADFRDGYLDKTSFKGASMIFADFRNAQLTGTDFEGTDLKGALFSNARIYLTKFEGADLGAADFSNSMYFPFSGIENAKLCLTIMPDGSSCNRDCENSGSCPWLEPKSETE